MPTVDDALLWARRGFNVFPCIPLAKEPAIDDYPNQATTDEAVIRQWWSDGRDYNVGIATGKGVHAFDIDTKRDKPGESTVDLFGLMGSFRDFRRGTRSPRATEPGHPSRSEIHHELTRQCVQLDLLARRGSGCPAPFLQHCRSRFIDAQR